MKRRITLLFIVASLMACETKKEGNKTDLSEVPIEGTWKLITGTLIEKGDTTNTDYTRDKSFIKIINDTHFAFLNHDLNKGEDTATASFSSGGGSYSLKDSSYTEHLEYCSDRQWEGHDFTFTVVIKNDTLIQSGVEVVESAGINRLNIERYSRVKK